LHRLITLLLSTLSCPSPFLPTPPVLLQTIMANGRFGMSVITALTAQQTALDIL